jgi:hypothetical protein
VACALFGEPSIDREPFALFGVPTGVAGGVPCALLGVPTGVAGGFESGFFGVPTGVSGYASSRGAPSRPSRASCSADKSDVRPASNVSTSLRVRRRSVARPAIRRLTGFLHAHLRLLVSCTPAGAAAIAAASAKYTREADG